MGGRPKLARDYGSLGLNLSQTLGSRQVGGGVQDVLRRTVTRGQGTGGRTSASTGDTIDESDDDVTPNGGGVALLAFTIVQGGWWSIDSFVDIGYSAVEDGTVTGGAGVIAGDELVGRSPLHQATGSLTDACHWQGRLEAGDEVAALSACSATPATHSIVLRGVRVAP